MHDGSTPHDGTNPLDGTTPLDGSTQHESSETGAAGAPAGHGAAPTPSAPAGPDGTLQPAGGPGTDDDLLAEVVRLRGEVTQLRAALSRRPVIDLAKGVVMALTGCDEEQAFRELSSISQTHNVKLFDLATALLADLPGLRAGGLLPQRWGSSS